MVIPVRTVVVCLLSNFNRWSISFSSRTAANEKPSAMLPSSHETYLLQMTLNAGQRPSSRFCRFFVKSSDKAWSAAI
jgi:hypothetical protein